MGWSETSQMISNYTHLTNKSVNDYFSRIYGVEPKSIEPLLPEDEKKKIKDLIYLDRF